MYVCMYVCIYIYKGYYSTEEGIETTPRSATEVTLITLITLMTLTIKPYYASTLSVYLFFIIISNTQL